MLWLALESLRLTATSLGQARQQPIRFVIVLVCRECWWCSLCQTWRDFMEDKNVNSRWGRGRSANWGNLRVSRWEKGGKTLERELPGELERELPGGDKMFQVWSPRVPPDNLAMPRPSQCRRGLRRSFCRKNSGRGLWGRLRGESSARARDGKQQQQKWDRPAAAAALPVKAAVVRFQAAAELRSAAAFAVKAAAVMRCVSSSNVGLSDEVERSSTI